MNKEKQRIKIAEACGIIGPFDDRWIKEYEKEGGDAYGFTGFENGELVFVRDYLNDLNAMHQAEKVLSRGKNYNQVGGFGFYLKTLGQICYDASCVDATAAQKSEALLKALNLWEDE